MTAGLAPLESLPQDARRRVRGVFTDIDDTLTTHGKLTAAAYAALERLQAAGKLVIPVTGRPAGWCDHIARMWPVDAIVGENGALAMRYDRHAHKLRRQFMTEADARATQRARLAEIGAAILAAVPGAALASDQQYRECDIAIDYCEDVSPLPRDDVDRIVALMTAHGMTARVSSIHVNGWFGAYDKLAMAQRLLAQDFGIDLDRERDTFVYIGDSPNDAPMFAFFPLSIGVANVRAFIDRIPTLPAYVTQAEAGAGFAEVVDVLLGGTTGA